MEKHSGDGGLTIEELREKYRIEKEKRLRPDGLAQFKELTGDFAEFDRDPFVEPGFAREPIVEETEVVIVGGGFGGMLTAISLTGSGITDFRIVEKAGDLGGTWYWNRYPGCMCDVESYTYLPLLEETGYMPTEKYASAPEIFAYCQLLGRTYDLYDHALFQTVITAAGWDDGSKRWQVSTNRDDRLSARFLVIAGGLLHKAKLPGIPGIEDFEGTAFHTSRWNYAYTGGSAREPMDKLADKRVGIIGTGATAVQVVPQLARTAEQLYVFQRTPSAVGVRNNAPTDVEWFNSLKPGWQAERIVNFTKVVTGTQPDENLVADGWTEALWVSTQVVPTSEEEAAELERLDAETMDGFRRRIDDIVEDPQTADQLKPWYGKHCKRMCFHDEYLPAFNESNVQLVDTDGRGVERITATGVVVDGVEYPVDCLVFASGFEITTDFDHRVGFDPVGRDGTPLSQRWSHGARTLHGVLSDGFPNMMMISLVQGGFGTNFVHFLTEASKHIASVIAICEEEHIETIEVSPEAEEDWLMVLYGEIGGVARYIVNCTPGYMNGEQGPHDAKAARSLVFAGSVLDYAGYLERWREGGNFPGATVVRADDPA